LTIAWGAMLASGALAVLIAHLWQKYRIEVPGLWLIVGGLVIYILLSWDQVFSGSWGSGPRASLLVTLACGCAARLRLLHILDRRFRRIDSYGRGYLIEIPQWMLPSIATLFTGGGHLEIIDMI